ncbi:MAG: hypothetical protein SGI74_12020 [Oligoflexia bacterium]|nr:hypothetical protein [Oligoflexia bacterium]
MLVTARGFIIFLSFLFSFNANANTLFEGWFEVYLGAKKIGYMTERFEFADKKFKATTYLKTNAEGGSITESLKAFAGPDLTPLNYSYTSKSGEEIKIIDATFKGELMTLKINDGKSDKKETKRIKKGTFLSSFLLYLIFQNGGLSVGKNFTYSAIAEEDGSAHIGKAAITSKEKIKDKETYKILNSFKGDKYFTWATAKGEIVLSRAPEKNIDVRFVASQAEATKGFMVNNTDLKLLFGKIPGETSTEIPTEETTLETQAADKKKRLTPTEPSGPAGKKAGVPAGEGLMIKGVPPTSAPLTTPTPYQKK